MTHEEQNGLVEALRLLEKEDQRQDQLHEILETIREQIRLGIEPANRPEGLMKNIQDAVYAMRGRTRLMDDAAILAALQAPQEAGVNVKALEWRLVDDEWWGADSVAGCYDVRQARAAVRVRFVGDRQFREFDGSVEEAKAAAQTDFDRRIRSALLQPEVQAVPEGCEGQRCYYNGCQHLPDCVLASPTNGGA